MTRSAKLAAFKAIFAILGLTAILTEIVVLVDRGVFNPGNFFSFFTILSNILAVIALATGAKKLFNKSDDSLNFELIRGAALLYMMTTGIIFSLLLSGLDPAVLTAVPWDNIVLHYIMPVVMVADWLIDPPKHGITFKRALIWLVFPLAYVVYSLVRGAIVNWYPYPFLDPRENGYMAVGIASIFVAVVILMLSWLISRFSTAKSKAL